MLEADLLVNLAKALGVAGVALGIYLLLFQGLISKLGMIKGDNSYRLARLALILISTITIIAIVLYFWASMNGKKQVDWRPSFDCRLARGWVENQICDDQHLSALDVLNKQLYERVHDTKSGVDQSDFESKKNLWVGERNICQTKACIEASFDERIKLLKAQ